MVLLLRAYALSLSLTPAEIFEITGKVQPAAQLRELRRMGIRAYRSDNPDRPVICLRVWLEAGKKPAQESEPRLKSEKKAA